MGMEARRLKKKEKREPEATILNEMIAYQEGAVVSRTLIEKGAGTVTLFAFDAGQGLSEHMAPYDALVQILEGEVRITVSGKSLVVKQGEMIILPSNKPHALFALTQFKMLLTMLHA